MSGPSVPAVAYVRRAFLKIDPRMTLGAVDALDLRAHAKVSAVVGVPLRQLQQRRDVGAFATSAPPAALRALLEVLARDPLEAIIALLGDDAEAPTYEQLRDGTDRLLASGSSVDEVVVVLAFAIGESFPAGPHCRRLFEERGEFSLPELPELVAKPSIVLQREVNPEVRAQRQVRREEEKRRKKTTLPVRAARSNKTKPSSPSRPSSAAPAVELAREQRREITLTPLENERFDRRHSLVGSILVVEVPFVGGEHEGTDELSKERPVLVVAASNEELLVRAIYSNPAPSRTPFGPWRRVGLDHASFIDSARRPVLTTPSDLRRQLGQLTTAEWNDLL